LIYYIWRRNCLLQHGKIEGIIDVMERQRRRRKEQLNGVKETREYWKLEGEALDCPLWSNSFIRGYGCLLRQTTL
jgi:hypothetical protein